MVLHRCLPSVLCFLMTAAFAAAQSGPAQTKKALPQRPHPAFARVADRPELPRVLLIGDSISIGYTLDVRKQLEGVANVHRIPTNGGPTTNGLKNIDVWLGDSKWDVIHFNLGLHDLKHVVGNSSQIVDTQTAGSHHQIPIDEYEANLRKLVERLKKTNAVLVWCSTTPVPEGAVGRITGDEVKYNAVAAKVMEEAGIRINDLYAFALPMLTEIQMPKNVHFSVSGSSVLAQQVSSEIKKALKEHAETN